MRGEHIGAVGIIREITERKRALGEELRIEDRLKDKVTELSIINEISEVLLSTRELDEILHMILIGATAYQALGFNRAFLFLVNEEVTMLEGEVATGTLTIAEAYQIWERLSHDQRSLEALLQSRQGELSQEDEPINNLVKQMKISLKGTESIFTQAVYEGKSFNIVNGAQNPLIDKKFLELLGTDAFALVPLVPHEGNLWEFSWRIIISISSPLMMRMWSVWGHLPTMQVLPLKTHIFIRASGRKLRN